jgi:hypothetical protein
MKNMNLIISLLFIVLSFTGCATHRTAENLIDESTVSFRLKKLEKTVDNLSLRVERVEHVKPSDAPSTKAQQMPLFFWAMIVIAGVLILINVFLNNFREWRKNKCDPG